MTTIRTLTRAVRVLAALALLLAIPGQALAWGKAPEPGWFEGGFWQGLDWSAVETTPWWSKQKPGRGVDTIVPDRFSQVKAGRTQLGGLQFNTAYEAATDGSGDHRVELYTTAEDHRLCAYILSWALKAFGDSPRWRDFDETIGPGSRQRDYQWVVGSTVVDMDCWGLGHTGVLVTITYQPITLKRLLIPITWFHCVPSAGSRTFGPPVPFTILMDQTGDIIRDSSGLAMDNKPSITPETLRYRSHPQDGSPIGLVAIDMRTRAYRVSDKDGKVTEQGACTQFVPGPTAF